MYRLRNICPIFANATFIKVRNTICSYSMLICLVYISWIMQSQMWIIMHYLSNDVSDLHSQKQNKCVSSVTSKRLETFMLLGPDCAYHLMYLRIHKSIAHSNSYFSSLLKSLIISYNDNITIIKNGHLRNKNVPKLLHANTWFPCKTSTQHNGWHHMITWHI